MVVKGTNKLGCASLVHFLWFVAFFFILHVTRCTEFHTTRKTRIPMTRPIGLLSHFICWDSLAGSLVCDNLLCRTLLIRWAAAKCAFGAVPRLHLVSRYVWASQFLNKWPCASFEIPFFMFLCICVCHDVVWKGSLPLFSNEIWVCFLFNILCSSLSSFVPSDHECF